MKISQPKKFIFYNNKSKVQYHREETLRLPKHGKEKPKNQIHLGRIAAQNLKLSSLKISLSYNFQGVKISAERLEAFKGQFRIQICCKYYLRFCFSVLVPGR